MPKHENNTLQKKVYNQFRKGYFFCRVCPKHGAHSTWAWVTPDWSIESWVACIALCSRDIHRKLGTCWLLFHCFHILITHYHCMAKQTLWLQTFNETNSVGLKFMPCHTNIMCIYAHNTPKNAHRLELFCIAFQYYTSRFTLFRLT